MRHVALNVQAIFTVLTEWLKESPGLSVLALVPEAERENLPHLQQVCRACKNFCVNGHPAGNCHIARSDDDRRKESSTQGVVGQPVG